MTFEIDNKLTVTSDVTLKRLISSLIIFATENFIESNDINHENVLFYLLVLRLNNHKQS